jgi:hypothetical protein
LHRSHKRPLVLRALYLSNSLWDPEAVGHPPVLPKAREQSVRLRLNQRDEGGWCRCYCFPTYVWDVSCDNVDKSTSLISCEGLEQWLLRELFTTSECGSEIAFGQDTMIARKGPWDFLFNETVGC